MSSTSTWSSTAPRDIDRFEITDSSDDDDKPIKEIKLDQVPVESTDSSDDDSESSSSSSSSSNSSSSFSSSSSDSPKKKHKKKQKDLNITLQTIAPEKIGEPLQTELDYLVTTHVKSNKRQVENTRDSNLRISQAKYTYFDPPEPDRSFVDTASQSSTMVSTVSKEISFANPSFSTKEMSLTNPNISTKEILRFKYKNYDYVPPIDGKTYDHLNYTQNGVPPQFKASRTLTKETKEAKQKKYPLWKDENVKKLEVKHYDRLNYTKDGLPEKFKASRKIIAKREKRLKEPLSYKFSEIKDNPPQFLSRLKQLPNPKSPPKPPQEKQANTQYKTSFKHHRSKSLETELPKKYEWKKIPNNTPRGMKLRAPEIYTKNGKEKMMKEREKRRIEQLAQETIYEEPPREPTLAETETALQKLLDEGNVREWEETHPKITPVPLTSSSSLSEDSDFSFSDSMMVENEDEAMEKIPGRKPYVDPHETEAARLRNQAIRQKLALRAAQERYNEEEDFERNVKNRVTAARVAATIRKLEADVQIVKKDPKEALQASMEDEMKRRREIEEKVRNAKNTEFIAKRTDRRAKIVGERNRRMKEKRAAESQIPDVTQRRKKKNEELLRLWDPNPANHFKDDED